MEILFTRHGETEWNILGKIQGCVDIELNDRGRNQAKELSEKLKDEKIDLIISSPLVRTVNTAEIINNGRNIPLQADKCLIERSFGIYEGLDRGVVDFSIFWDMSKNLPIENGESLEDFLERIKGFLKFLKENYNDKRVLLVSHGGVSIAMQYLINGLADDGCLPKPIKNCEVLTFNI